MKTKRQNMSKPFSLKELGRKALTVLLTIAMVSMNSPFAYAAEAENVNAEAAVDQIVATEPEQTTEQAPEEQQQEEQPVEPENTPAEVTSGAPTAEVVEEEPTATTEAQQVTIGLALDHGYIHYMYQAIAAPISSLELPTNEDFVFAATADEGYELTEVKVEVDGKQTALEPNEDGTYTVPMGMLTSTTRLIVKAQGLAIESEEGTAAVDEKRNTKDTFEYEDDDIKVTVTLADPSVLPDGVEFKVTAVTPTTEGYSYDAYLEALNKDKDAEATDYTQENTKVYDVAFLVTNKDGKVEEVEPAEGSVKVNFDFKQKQLADDLKVENAEDLEVTHLTVDESVIADASTTQEATNVKPNEIVIEKVATDVNLNAEVAEFTTESFSIFVFKDNSATQTNMWDGTNVISQSSIWSVLEANNADNFAVVASRFESKDHVEGNVRVATYATQGSSGNLNEGQRVVTYNGLASITVNKTVTGGSDGTFTFAFYDGTTRVGNTFTITTNGGKGVVTLTPNTASDVFVQYNLGKDLQLYELDGKGQRVEDGGKNGDYTVNYTYSYSEESSDLALNSLDNYIGHFEISGEWATGVDNHYFGNDNYAIKNYFGDDVYIQNNALHIGDKFQINNYNNGSGTMHEYTHVDGLKATIESEMSNLADLSVTLANAKNGEAGTNGTDINVINVVSQAGITNIYDDLSAANFNPNKNVTGYAKDGTQITGAAVVKGLVADQQPVLINVDLTGKTEYTITGQEIFYDGLNPQGDNGYTDLGRLVVYNLVVKNADGSYAPYTGTVKVGSWSAGLLLAPRATVDQTSAYWIGSIVGGTVKHGGQEIHKVTRPAEGSRYVSIGVTNTKGDVVERTGTVSLNATKTMKNGNWGNAGSFTFTVSGSDGAPMPAETSKTVSQSKPNAVFGPISFTGDYPDEVTYTYTIRESIPGDAVNAEGKKYSEATDEEKSSGTWVLDTITYDAVPTIATVKVKNSASDNTKIDTTVTYTKAGESKDKAVFENEFKVKETKAHLEAKKIFQDGTITDEQFGFQLLAADGTQIDTAYTDIDNNNIATFDDITYKSAGTFTYKIKEIIPAGATRNTAGKLVLNGIEYDESEYTATVVVSENGGKLEANVTYAKGNEAASASIPEFTNKYTATDSITFTGQKIIEGRDRQDDDIYTFTIKEGDKTIAEVQNDAEGNIPYPAINYTLKDVGEHTYIVDEVVSNKAGMTKATNAYTVVVNVTDKGNGTLQATITSDAKTLSFTNKYEATGSVTFEGTKSIEGRDLKDGDTFSFAVYEIVGGKEVLVQEVQSDATGKINYPTIEYTLSKDKGTHNYKVKETSTNGNGITVDTKTYDVTVEVADSDEHDGTLKITKSDNASALNFTNTYEAYGEITFKGTKTLEGRDLAAGEFNFEVKEGDKVVATGTNDADGKINFTKIQYHLNKDVDNTGVHHYVVTEVASTLSGIKKNTQSFNVDVTVTDNKNGTLGVSATDNYQNLDFINTFESSDDVVFSATKTFNGKVPAKDAFSFKLKETQGNKIEGGEKVVKNDEKGVATFDAIAFNQNDVGKTFTYEISEVAGSDASITYDRTIYTATVRVALENNKVVAHVSYKDNKAPVFTNTSKDSFEINGTKTLQNRAFKQGDKITFNVTGAKTVSATEAEVPMPANTSVEKDPTSGDSVPFTFGAVEVDADDIGNTYVYTVTETAKLSGVTNDTATHTVTVTVSADDNGNIQVAKTSSDNEDGTLSFVNTYSAQNSITFKGNKSIDVRDLTANDIFTFEVWEGETLVASVNNAADGKINYPTITYVLNGEKNDTGTHTYTVKEATESLNGTKKDTNEYTVTVDVSDDGSGTLVVKASDNYQALDFVNTYEATGTTTFTGEKTIEGRPFMDTDTFTFEIKEGDKVVATATSRGGKIDYPELTYTLKAGKDETGVHNYKVYETTTDAAGIVIDTTVYDVTVTVSDNKDGSLSVVKSSNADALNFKNKYEAQGNIDLEVKKKLDGSTLQAGQFSFQLWEATKNADGTFTKGAAIGEPVANAADGTVKFPLSYDQDDITYGDPALKKSDRAHFAKFYYIVTEVIPEAATKLDDTHYALGNYIYDATEKPFTVTVNDFDTAANSYRSELNVTIDNQLDDIATFTNEDVQNGKIVLEAQKKMSGANLSQYDPFTFELKDADGKVIDTKKTVNGIATFNEIAYDAEDVGKTFTYTINEVNDGRTYLAYDGHTETVTVKVEKKDGKIVATPTYDEDGVVFTNTYAATGEATFGATKTLENKNLEDGMFSFTLRGYNLPSEGVTVTNAGTSVSFPAIPYTQEDLLDADGKTYHESKTFEYTITEALGDSKGVTYDSTTKTVNVTVTDNHEGTLVVTYDNKPTLEGVAFANTYNATGSIVLEAEKDLNGNAPADDTFSFALYAGTDTTAKPLQTKPVKGGTVTFDAINYTLSQLTETNAQGQKTRDFTYTIKEIIPKGAALQENGTYLLNGYTYDGHEEQVVVTVTDNGDSTLSAIANKQKADMHFANTYAATGSAVFFATKTLNGTAPADRVFTFQLKDADGRLLQEKDSDANGSVAFDAIEYNLNNVGDYTYTINEKIPAGAEQVNGVWTLNGVSYDSHVVTETVHVRDNGNGTLRVTYGDGEDEAEVFHGAIFANTYAAEADYTLHGRKVIDGRKFLDGDSITFSVSAVEIDAEGNPVAGAATPAVPADVTLTPTTNDNTNIAPITFSALHYTLDDAGKTYRYTVTETINHGPNVVAEEKVHTVDVSVVDNGNGTLSVNDTYSDGTALDFTNTYTATGQLLLSGTKTLEGRPLEEGDTFTFEIAEDGAPLTTVTNDATGKINYPALVFSLKDVGTHVYTVRETTKDANGVTVDTNVHEFTATIRDKGDGTLDIQTTGDDPEALDFINTYEAKAEVPLSGTKILEGRDMTDADVYKFGVYEVVDGEEKLVKEVTNDATGKIDYPTLSYVKKAGQDDTGVHTYKIRETSENGDGVTVASNEYDLTVTVTDNKTGELQVETQGTPEALDFTNTYTANGHVDIEATKILRNRRWKKGEKFTFVLTGGKGDVTVTRDTAEVETDEVEKATDNEGNTDVSDATEVKTQKVVKHVANFSHEDIPALNFTQADMDTDGNGNPVETTYTYYLREQLPEGVTVENPTDESTGITYDTSIYTIEVTLKSDDGKGNLTVEKKYKDAAGNEIQNIEFANTYQAKSISTGFEATKQFQIKTNTNTNKQLERGQFQFVLKDNTGTVLQTRTNGVYVNEQGAETQIDADKVQFTPITYTAVDTYIYRIEEVIPDTATNANGVAYGKANSLERAAGGFKLNGIEYDSTVYYSQVYVTDTRLMGQLEVNQVYNNGEIDTAPVFTNKFFESQAQAHINKAYYGADIQPEFEFLMAAADENFNVDTATSVATKITNGEFNNHLAEVVSDNISYYEPGTYRYVIWEATESDESMTSDAAKVYVTVVVDDDANATVSYAINVDGQTTEVPEGQVAELYNNGLVAMAFRAAQMRMGAEAVRLASFEPAVQKQLKNGILKGGDFQFSIYAGDTVSGAPMQTVTNDVNGKISFDAIMFGEDNIGKTYTYTIVEQPTADQTIITDKRAITLTIKVGEDENGAIKLDAEYYELNDEGTVELTENPAFVNEYDSIVIHAIKRSREEPYDPLPGAHYGLWMVNPNGEDVYMGLGRNQLEIEGSELVSSDHGDLYYDIPLLEGVAYYFLEEWPPPAGHLVDPYPTDYFTLVHDEENGQFRLVYESEDDFSKYCPGITH